jgi:hypothetical protein
VDLYGATIDKEVSDRQAARALAQLDQWFRRHADRTVRLRFLGNYLAQRFGAEGASGDRLRRWAEAVERAGRSNAAVLFAKRDRRVWRRGAYFTTLKLGSGWQGTVPLAFRNRDEFPRPVHPDRTADEWDAVLKGYLRHPDELGQLEPVVAAERWLASGVGEGLLWRLGGSPARRAFEVGHGLRHRDIPCVWPIALLERRSVTAVGECHLLLERRGHCHPLGDLPGGGSEWAERWSDSAWRGAVLESVGRLVAEAALVGVRWGQPQLGAIWIECEHQATDRPRALFRRPEGVSFGREPDVQQGAQAALALAGELASHSERDSAAGRALLTAFRNRLGRAFRRPPGWPDDAAEREK